MTMMLTARNNQSVDHFVEIVQEMAASSKYSFKVSLTRHSGLHLARNGQDRAPQIPRPGISR